MERFNESDKIAMVMSEQAIEEACNFSCIPVRNSYMCPHNRSCRLQFNREIGPIAVRSLRQCVWSVDNPGVSNRKECLQRQLESMIELSTTSKQRQIIFMLNGVRVCKSFFKVMLSSLVTAYFVHSYSV